MAYLLHGLLTEAAARQPQRPAVAAGGQVLTYQELDQLSNKVARALRRLGVAPGDRVGVLAPKSAASVIGIYGVLKAGACYVPLDPKAPAQRLSYVVRDSGAAVIVADEVRASGAAVLIGGVQRSRGVLVTSVPGSAGGGEGAIDQTPDAVIVPSIAVAAESEEPLADGTGDRDRPRVHPVHLGIDRRAEGRDDLPPQLALVCRVGSSRSWTQ